MNIDELSEDSDTSDDDYVPGSKPEELPSEAESNGDSEDPLSDTEDLGKRGLKRSKKAPKSRKKQKICESKLTANESDREETSELNEQEKKKQEEDIWADFMKDTGFQSKNSKNEPLVKEKPKPVSSRVSDITSSTKPVEKVKITQVFDFAGEEVKVEKEVAADSAEARLLSKSTPETSSKRKPRGSLSGIGSVLSQLGKKPKISTLEKSKLDWDKFKKEENIEEELQTHNKGKDGYLDRQDFLQRADLRRFEIEKEIRTVERNKRMNI